MPTWSKILTEVQVAVAEGRSVDSVRRKYLKNLHDFTKRNIILYATAFTQKGGPSELLSITEEDIQGMMEVVYGLEKDMPVDFIIHSPGGSPEAAEGIVNYLHEQFGNNIRVIVPQIAMSAATMIACSGKSIVMGKHSSIGPIDPQLIINTPSGITSNPAKAIIDQFYKALSEINQQGKQAWSILLKQYAPSLISQCENYIAMSEKSVKQWLEQYMFDGDIEKEKKSENISKYLANHDNFKSHGKHISRKLAEEIGLKIEYLEEIPDFVTDIKNQQKFQDLVLSVFHSTTLTFQSTRAMKIIENHNGSAFIKII